MFVGVHRGDIVFIVRLFLAVRSNRMTALISWLRFLMMDSISPSPIGEFCRQLGFDIGEFCYGLFERLESHKK